LGAEGAALCSVDVFIRFGHGVDPYFHLPMFGPPDGWQKIWFFLRNNTDVTLPMFMGSRPILQPNWVSYPVLRSNRMLIVCVLRNQVYTHTI
jgi:hypothetical protein